jgi:hypothetical protein
MASDVPNNFTGVYAGASQATDVQRGGKAAKILVELYYISDCEVPSASLEIPKEIWPQARRLRRRQFHRTRPERSPIAKHRLDEHR